MSSTQHTNPQSQVAWVNPDRPAGASATMKLTEDRIDQTSAIVVIVLTLACSALAIYDLFLLAAASAPH